MNLSEATTNYQPTACILCSRNCGIEVEVRGRELAKIRGDKRHPISAGYLCQKAQRLNYYQNHADRLSSPLRRRDDGSFEEISWEVAVEEIAAKLLQLRDTHGGHSLAFFGGGGQGNHLGGPYAKAMRSAMRTQNYYNALAQEKTGGFWVDGHLYGRQNCHPTEDVENAAVVVFIGTNPWQSHGIRNAREVLHEIRKDPQRTMIVIDPRKTETAAMADIHLQLKPGTDAYLLSALLAVIVSENREARDFIARHTTGFEAVRDALMNVPIEEYARRSGIEVAEVYRTARLISDAESCAVRTDLGIEQTLNSTLNLYLRAMLSLITGNFGKRGGINLHTSMVPLVGHSTAGKEYRSKVNNFPAIGNLLPPNILPSEIDTDHPNRIRGMVVDSANPMVTMADTQAYREAFAKLDLLVVIDVAMTETAQLAHYVLPASSQFEKWEATFFNLEFPKNAFHLRKPLFEPLQGTLAEAEIYTRIIRAMGEIPADFSELADAAKQGRMQFAIAFKQTLAAHPEWRDYAPIMLYETLGKTLPDGAAAAAFLWATAHQFAAQHPEEVRRAGHKGEGLLLGEVLFAAILNSPSGVLFSVNEYEESWKFLKHKDGLIHLEIPEMLAALVELNAAPTSEATSDYPFTLVAGERRAYNANTIYRDPKWRKSDADGALKIHSEDAATLNLADGSWARCESKRGAAIVRVEINDSLCRGMVTLPHGYGMEYPLEDGKRQRTGAYINELTSAEDRDPIAGTPYHKYVPVRITRVEEIAVN